MRRHIIAAMILLMATSMAWGQTPDARQIMEKQKSLHETGSETATIVMLLVDKGGQKKQREMRSWKKTMGDGLSRSLMAFTSPSDIAGTALLNWETGENEAQQWLYLPATGKMQRVAGNSKTEYFMGTDFTYEDMEIDDLDRYAMTLTGEDELDGQACWVIEVAPADEAKRKESGYGKRVFHVRKDIVFTIRIEYYDPRGRLVKVQTAHDLERVSGDRWMARKSLMDNKRAKHQTLMGFVSREVDAVIDDEVFSRRFVLEGRHTQQNPLPRRASCAKSE